MIAILLATYNSMPYLVEQLDSIISQDNHNWHLYIHDDGSTDDTIHVIEQYIEKYPDLITRMVYPSQGGARDNFMSLLQRVEAQYYMFCDHDDVWHTDKVSRSLSEMKRLELTHHDKPIIVHSDVTVVEKDLSLRHPSYREYAHIYPEKVKSLEDCVICTTIGCTMFFNRASRDSAIALSWKDALMHDIWVVITTYANHGIVYSIPDSLMEYRQTGNNTIGAIDGNRFTIKYRLTHIRSMHRLNCAQYKMLRSVGFGSCLLYYYKKLMLHIG